MNLNSVVMSSFSYHATIAVECTYYAVLVRGTSAKPNQLTVSIRLLNMDESGGSSLTDKIKEKIQVLLPSIKAITKETGASFFLAASPPGGSKLIYADGYLKDLYEDGGLIPSGFDTCLRLDEGRSGHSRSRSSLQAQQATAVGAPFQQNLPSSRSASNTFTPCFEDNLATESAPRGPNAESVAETIADTFVGNGVRHDHKSESYPEYLPLSSARPNSRPLPQKGKNIPTQPRKSSSVGWFIFSGGSSRKPRTRWH